MNSKGIGQLVLIGIVLIAVLGFLFIVLSEPELAGGFAPFETAGTPSTVLVPVIGTIWCQASDSPLETDYLKKENVYYQYNQITLESYQIDKFISIDEIGATKVSGVVYNTETYRCDGLRCEFSVSPDNFRCFNASLDAQPIYDIYKNNDIVFSRKVKVNPTFGKISYTDGFYSGNYSENDSIRFRVMCGASPPNFASYHLKGERITRLNVPIKVFTKRLVWKALGTEIPISGTSGCTSDKVVEALNNAPASQPKDKEFNLWGWFEETSLEESDLEESKKLLDSPKSMNIGDYITAVVRWEEIPFEYNIIKLPDGTFVFRALPSDDVYLVKKVELENGSSIWVADEVYERNVDCMTNAECNAKYGKDWQCNLDTFECFLGQQRCTASAECGTDNFVEEGGKFYFFYYECVGGFCEKREEQKVCHPDRSYPFNGCPIDKTRCVNGDYCIEDIPPIKDCPSECCLAGSGLYREKTCSSGMVCETSGGFVGICVSTPPTVVCGDKFCDLERGETYLNCPADCPPPIIPSGVEFDWLPIIIAVVIVAVALVVGFVYIKK